MKKSSATGTASCSLLTPFQKFNFHVKIRSHFLDKGNINHALIMIKIIEIRYEAILQVQLHVVLMYHIYVYWTKCQAVISNLL